MKKIFILMLSTLMLLASPALMTYAATGPGLAEKGKGMNVNVTASQNEDGDLVISVSGEQKEEFINLVTQEHKYTYKDSRIDYNSYGYGGNICIKQTYINTSYEFVNAQVYDVDGNKIDEATCNNNNYSCEWAYKKEIIRDGDNLIIKKEIISKKVNVVSDTLTLYFWNDNPDEDMHRLLDYEVKVDVKFEGAPEIKKFNLVNYVLNNTCRPGASTKIDLSGAYLESDNGEKIYPYSEGNKETYFDIYWADKAYDSYSDSFPSRTSDETFQNGKEYSLITLLKHENNNNRIFIDVPTYNSWYVTTIELNFDQKMWFINGMYLCYSTEQQLQYTAAIVTGSKYLEDAVVHDDSIDTEDKKMMDEGIEVYEYLIIDNENISEDVSKAFKSYADKNGYVLDEIFNFKTMKNSLYGYLNSPLSGREITTLSQEAEFFFPIKKESINTDPNIERIYEVLYIDNKEIKTVDVFSGVPPYIDKEELESTIWGCYFNSKQAAGTYALVYKDTKKTEDVPVIIDGTNLSVIAGDKKDLSFTSNASYSDFKEVKIDGATLDNKNYSVKSGSTIVTLFANYVSTLSVGEHEISIVSTNGTATTKFTVKKKETSPTPTPSTNSDKAETVVATKSYSAKDKNHDGVVTCDEEMNSANWIWSESKKACVYKVANTSAN